MAETCEMKSQVRAQAQNRPFQIDVISTLVLCLASDGDANLAPLTATARITNTAATPVTVTYAKSAAPAFRSTGVWDAQNRAGAQFFPTPPGQPGASAIVKKTLGRGESLLISSWTRHHPVIWSAVQNGTAVGGGALPLAPLAKRDFVVQFALRLAYAMASGPTRTMTQDFAIDITAVAPGAAD